MGLRQDVDERLATGGLTNGPVSAGGMYSPEEHHFRILVLQGITEPTVRAFVESTFDKLQQMRRMQQDLEATKQRLFSMERRYEMLLEVLDQRLREEAK